jgi:hypothetical protein
VEDFAYESAVEKTLRWFVSAVRLLEATGLLAADDEFVKTALAKTDTLKAWRQSHEDELHTAAEISTQLEKTGSPMIREDAAYYFRYVANAITPVDKRNEVLQTFAEQEQRRQQKAQSLLSVEDL